MPRGKDAKLARAVTRKAMRGKATVKPIKGKRKTRKDNNETRKSQQEWVGGDEWRVTNQITLMMNSQGVTNPKHILEQIIRYRKMEEKLKAHLQDQECK